MSPTVGTTSIVVSNIVVRGTSQVFDLSITSAWLDFDVLTSMEEVRVAFTESLESKHVGRTSTQAPACKGRALNGSVQEAYHCSEKSTFCNISGTLVAEIPVSVPFVATISFCGCN
jgi:hypothetical protein